MKASRVGEKPGVKLMSNPAFHSIEPNGHSTNQYINQPINQSIIDHFQSIIDQFQSGSQWPNQTIYNSTFETSQQTMTRKLNFTEHLMFTGIRLGIRAPKRLHLRHTKLAHMYLWYTAQLSMMAREGRTKSFSNTYNTTAMMEAMPWQPVTYQKLKLRSK